MENKIKIMSEGLANKIAAGEVVEKCASVVKELVENSIDAGATNIKVELSNAGLKMIKVVDNGIGMNHDDALLAFQRHATSKLLSEDDLFFIDTLGFRGEALPSIASVSEVMLETCNKEVGTKIVIKGGKLISDEHSQSKIGTTIEVKNLFYNTPARLKYLKSEQAELANTISYMEKLSLSHPNIAFTLVNNDKTFIKTSGSNNLLKCIHEIYGLSVSNKMIEIKGSNDDFEIRGYICKPEILKSSRNHMVTIVNDRIVRNNDLNRFINDAYYTYKPEGKYPIVVINIKTDPTLIDVNIHPTKQDIKISKINELGDLIVQTIKNALYQTLLVPNVDIKKINNIDTEYIIEDKIKESNDEIDEIQTEFDLGIKEDNVKVEIIVNAEIKSLVLYPVGLVHGTYIVAENDEGMYLIDQHAAEERINYEKLMKALKSQDIITTAVLFPITVELSSSEFESLKEGLEILFNLGFKVEEFGVNTYVFKEHPTWLRVGHEEESIRKIIDLIIEYKDRFDAIKFQEALAITMACKISIKGNTRINHEDMELLLNDLVLCDNPYNCPHGRPTIIKFSIYDLERMFKRAMN